MYNPRPQKEPNGCLQTLVITRIILQILFVPMMLVAGGIAAVLVFFFALTVNPLYGLAVLLVVGFLLYLLGRWEASRTPQGPPPSDPY
jgi:hypothetical protein